MVETFLIVNIFVWSKTRDTNNLRHNNCLIMHPPSQVCEPSTFVRYLLLTASHPLSWFVPNLFSINPPTPFVPLPLWVVFYNLLNSRLQRRNIPFTQNPRLSAITFIVFRYFVVLNYFWFKRIILFLDQDILYVFIWGDPPTSLSHLLFTCMSKFKSPLKIVKYTRPQKYKDFKLKLSKNK